MKKFLFFLLAGIIAISGGLLLFSRKSADKQPLPTETEAFNKSEEPLETTNPDIPEAAELPETTEIPESAELPTNTEAPEEPAAVFEISKISDEIFARMQGKSYPEDCPLELDTLRYLTVTYVNFDGDICQGELIVNTEIAEDVISIFKELFEIEYPIESIRLIDDFDADDNKSMAANNSSGFCYRVVDGTDRLSNHSFGLAVDINPLYNPYIKSNGKVLPEEAEAFADRTVSNPYYITPEDDCVRIFKKYGFTWGGDWTNSKDYQHFQRKL